MTGNEIMKGILEKEDVKNGGRIPPVEGAFNRMIREAAARPTAEKLAVQVRMFERSNGTDPYWLNNIIKLTIQKIKEDHCGEKR